MFEFPMRRPHPLTANLLGRIEARRVPASSHPATRDAAKTYVSPRKLDQPLAQGFFRPNRSRRTCRFGGKLRIDNSIILAGNPTFSQAMAGPLWINKTFNIWWLQYCALAIGSWRTLHLERY